ncbi:MAG: transcriptional regulator [Labilithrix sp.]|nr:transcriptional regulator [Labilithrix sp.]
MSASEKGERRTDEKTRRDALSAFLRSRRERLTPDVVGLHGGSRRRTPGLRREEVAGLAGVGLAWYTWFEQGRQIEVSETFLENLARALRLDPAERAHLFVLAHGRPPPLSAVVPPVVSAALQRVLDVHPYPALVWNLRWDVVAWNRASSILYGDFAERTPDERNSLWVTFTDPELRRRMPQWEANARGMIARFRLDFGGATSSPDFTELVERLLAVSPEFDRWWHEQEVVAEPEGTKSLVHPAVGTIAFDHVLLMMTEGDGRRLRVAFYSPCPGESEERAARLFGAPAPSIVPPTARSLRS